MSKTSLDPKSNTFFHGASSKMLESKEPALLQTAAPLGQSPRAARWRWRLLIRLHAGRLGLTAVATQPRGFFNCEPMAGHRQDLPSLRRRWIISSEQKQADQDLLLTYNSQKYLTSMRLFLRGRRARPNPRTLRCLLLLAELLFPQPGSSMSRHEVQVGCCEWRDRIGMLQHLMRQGQCCCAVTQADPKQTHCSFP